MINPVHLAEGALNLIKNCAEITEQDNVVLFHEDPTLGWYDLEGPKAVFEQIQKLGAKVNMVQVDGPANEPNDQVSSVVEDYDVVIFFARIGDQDRFAEPPKNTRIIMSYIRTAQMLASSYGRLHHGAMIDLKEAVNRVLMNADEVVVTCNKGTNFSGHSDRPYSPEAMDVGVRRFPMGVHIPLATHQFKGDVVIDHYLTPTGSKVYDPAFLEIKQPVSAQIEKNQITSIAGDSYTIAMIKDHYDMVAKKFDLKWNYVHSWHSGIHPGMEYDMAAMDDPDRWSNTVFTSPRYLHIHTCGAYPPGEVCLMVHLPTVSADGIDLWKDGKLLPENFAETRIALKQWPELEAAFTDAAVKDGLN